MNFGDPIDDPLNDLDLAILKIVDNNPGLNVPKLLQILSNDFENISIDKIKNSLKRHLVEYCEFRGSRNSGGYYIKRR